MAKIVCGGNTARHYKESFLKEKPSIMDGRAGAERGAKDADAKQPVALDGDNKVEAKVEDKTRYIDDCAMMQKRTMKTKDGWTVYIDEDEAVQDDKNKDLKKEEIRKDDEDIIKKVEGENKPMASPEQETKLRQERLGHPLSPPLPEKVENKNQSIGTDAQQAKRTAAGGHYIQFIERKAENKI